MKFSVPIADFQKSLQKTLSAIPPKSTLPVLEHLHFSLNGNKLRVVATDQDITIMSTTNVTGIEDGVILVPGRRLNEIIRALGNTGEIEFKADDSNFDILITTKTGKFAMKGLNPVEYLNIPELFESAKPGFEKAEEVIPASDSDKVSFKKEDLIELSSKTAFAVSTDEFRPGMTGVLFRFRETYVCAVATDSYRLAKAVVKSDKPVFPVEMDLIIPARSVELLKKVEEDVLMSTIRTHNKITHARFEFGDTIFITKIIDEKFPPYESVIPDNNNLIAVVDQREIIHAIQRVSIQTSSISKQIKMTIYENAIKIFGRDEEYGTEADEEIACEYNGEKLDVGFNYKYLLDALQNVDAEKDDYKVLLTFSEPARPVLIRPMLESNELLMLIMPVRIS